jgi:hypothetical protein
MPELSKSFQNARSAGGTQQILRYADDIATNSFSDSTNVILTTGPNSSVQAPAIYVPYLISGVRQTGTSGQHASYGYKVIYDDDENGWEIDETHGLYIEQVALSTENTAAQNDAAFVKLKNWLDDHPGKFLRSAGGTFLFEDEVEISKAHGWMPGTVFDHNGSTGTISGLAATFVTGGGKTQIEDLSVAASAGESQITLASTPSIAAGDYFLIHDDNDNSFNAWRTQNKKGEFNRVISVSGNDVKLEKPLKFDYTTVNADLYKVELAEVFWGGLTCIAPGQGSSHEYASAISFRWCRGLVQNVIGKGSDNQSFTFDMCYGLHGVGIEAEQLSDSGTPSTGYGFRFNSSDDCTAQGNFTGYRYGCDAGPVAAGVTGGVVKIPINCIFKDSSCFGNLSTTHTSAARLHAHVGCGYDNVNVYGGGLGFSGADSFFKGGSVNVSEDTPNAGMFVPSELHNFSHVIGTEETVWNYYADSESATGRNPIDIGDHSTDVLNSDTVGGGVMRFAGVWNLPSVSGRIVKIQNQGYTGDAFGLSFDDIIINAPSSTALIDFDASTGGGDDPEFMYLGDVDATEAGFTQWAQGGTSVSTKFRGFKYCGTVDISVTTGAASASAAVTFDIDFPKSPCVQVSGESLLTGTDPYICAFSSLSAAGFTGWLQTADGSNFGSADTTTVHWTAELNEY